MGSYVLAQFRAGKALPFTIVTKQRNLWTGRALFHTSKKRKESFPNINLTGSFLRTRGVNNPTPSHRIIRCPYPDIAFPDVPLHEFIWEGIAKWHNQKALTCGVTGRSYTYGEARDAARRWGSALLRLGLRQGDGLALCLPNAPEFAIVALGALEAGLAITALPTDLDQDEMSRQVGAARPAAAVGAGALLRRLLAAGASAKARAGVGGEGLRWKAVVSVEGLAGVPPAPLPPAALTLQQLLAAETQAHAHHEQPRFPEVRGEHLAVIAFTSGSTGPPKGVRLSHANVVTTICQISHEAFSQTKPASESFQEELVCSVPLYHCYGMNVVMLTRMHMGAHIVTLSDPSPETYLKALSNVKSTELALTPSLMHWLAAAPSLPAAHLERLHTVMAGGAPMAPHNTERLVSRLRPNVAFQSGYGMVETTSAVTQTTRWERELGTVGCLVPNTRAKVVNDEGTALGAGHTGHILVKGPQLMQGYLNDDAAMQAKFDSEGWLRTGDLGLYDDEHRFRVVDRLDEIINVSGVHTLAVAPAELEEVLRGHPGVAEAAVVAAPHPTHGQVPRAFVVRKRSFVRLTERELLDEVAQRTPPYKHLLGGVVFVDELPKAPTGNVKRYLLKGK